MAHRLRRRDASAGCVLWPPAGPPRHEPPKERGCSAGSIGGPGAQFTAERRDPRQATARRLAELTARMGGF
jgi:hypothetical protein